MIEDNEFELWADDTFCKLSEIVIEEETNKRLVITAKAQGSMKLILKTLWEEHRKDVIVNGKSLREYPELIEELDITFLAKHAKKVGHD